MEDAGNSKEVTHAIAALWEKYRPMNLERVAAMEAVLVALEQERLSEETRLTGEREAHKLAGAAGSYGHARVSELAHEMELLCRDRGVLQSFDRDRLRAMIAELRGAVEGDGMR